jgi:hypothetical protein
MVGMAPVVFLAPDEHSEIVRYIFLQNSRRWLPLWIGDVTLYIK